VPATLAASATSARRQRVAHGDWQTPRALAEAVVACVLRAGEPMRAVLEPTCGTGAFLAAAARVLPAARLVGFDRSAAYVEAARRELGAQRAELHVSDFFAHDWSRTLRELPEPFLLLGNPPWVTSSTLGALSSGNLPEKSNYKRHAGFDALTGKANFDISEWMLTRLLAAARGRKFTLAMLCKAAVARRIMLGCAADGSRVEGSVYGVDARSHFSASVSAVLLVLRSHTGAERPRGEASWAVYPSLAALEPVRTMGVLGGHAYSDLDALRATAGLEGASERTWRSGVKHDLARVMELRERDGALVNGLGEKVAIERELVYPLCKSSELAGARAERRFVLLTQARLGEDTSLIRERAPATFDYLERHRAAFEARKSRIYLRQPPFAMFGVGPYTFAPYKVAISALHKRLAFSLLGPVGGRPVVLDDTAYFLPCESLAEAERLVLALSSPLARSFFEARIFWDDMRPITKGVLATLSLERLLAATARAAG
jgi:hypothetical protein